MVVDENKDDVMLQLTQRRRNVMIMDKCWLLMLVVAQPPSVSTCTLEDDTKGIVIDTYMDLSVLIWSIIFLYKHNSDDNF